MEPIIVIIGGWFVFVAPTEVYVYLPVYLKDWRNYQRDLSVEEAGFYQFHSTLPLRFRDRIVF